MLKQRVITGIILIALTIGALFFTSPAVFSLILAAVTVAAGWEWTNLMGVKSYPWRYLYLVILLGFLFNSLFMPFPFVMSIAVLWWLFAAVLVMCYPRGCAWFARSAGLRGVMGILVLVPCWRAVCFIRSMNDGISVLLFLFVLIWGADTAAYFAGKRFGTIKLAPEVSPGKSIQGVIAAMLFGVIVTFAILKISDVPHDEWFAMLLLGIATVLFSVLGDLFESLLKRQANLKDSGKLLPGHGGLLDRIDSLTAAAPVFALGAYLLGV